MCPFLVQIVAMRIIHLTFGQRVELVRKVENGTPISAVAKEFEVSRQTVHKWYERALDGGEAALEDRSSAPDITPTKIQEKIKSRLIKLVFRHPEQTLSWYRKALYAKISRAAVHAILAHAGLGSRADRMRRVLTSCYRSRGDEIQDACSKPNLLANCFRNRDFFANKSGAEFLMISTRQPIRNSRRNYQIWFIFDLFDLQAAAVLDDRQYWDYDQKRALATVLSQQGLQDFFSVEDSAPIVAWLKLIRKPVKNMALRLIYSVQGSATKNLKHLAVQIRPLDISLSDISHSEVVQIPWISEFLRQWNSFQESELNCDLAWERGSGQRNRRTICEAKTAEFVQKFNSSPITLFPYLGESPKTFRKHEITKVKMTCSTISLHNLLGLRDKNQLISEPPPLGDILKYFEEMKIN